MKRAEYSSRTSGKLYGLENQEATKTLFTIMIKSVSSKYHDVIAMIPIINIDASQIFEVFDKIVKGIHQVGFDAIATIVDGHSSNTKFFKTLSQNFNGKETCITDDEESSDERTPHDLETDETVGSLVKEPVAVKTVSENGIKNTGGSTLKERR